MWKGHRITIVVPARNEERFIGQVIRAMPDFVDNIIVVDDFSNDRTSQIAAAEPNDRVLVVKTSHQRGVGGATLIGYRKALDLGADVVVKMDGDGQMDPKYLPSLLEAVVEQGYHYAKGNRFLAGESLDSMPKHRLVANVVLTFLTKVASGYWHVFDPQNGYTAIGAEVLRVLDLDAIREDYFFENDMLFQLSCRGFRVKDVPIPARYGGEDSNIDPFRVGLTFSFLLARRFFRRIYQRYVLRDFSPIALFLFFGLILFSWGVSFGAYLWIKAVLTDRPTPTGTIMLCVLPLILGFQLLLQAVVLDIQETPK